MFPGVVSLEYPAWCWVHKALEVEVVLGKQRPLQFNQTGFSLQYSVSKDTLVVGKRQSVLAHDHLSLDLVYFDFPTYTFAPTHLITLCLVYF